MEEDTNTILANNVEYNRLGKYGVPGSKWSLWWLLLLILIGVAIFLGVYLPRRNRNNKAAQADKGGQSGGTHRRTLKDPLTGVKTKEHVLTFMFDESKLVNGNQAKYDFQLPAGVQSVRVECIGGGGAGGGGAGGGGAGETAGSARGSSGSGITRGKEVEKPSFVYVSGTGAAGAMGGGGGGGASGEYVEKEQQTTSTKTLDVTVYVGAGGGFTNNQGGTGGTGGAAGTSRITQTNIHVWNSGANGGQGANGEAGDDGGNSSVWIDGAVIASANGGGGGGGARTSPQKAGGSHVNEISFGNFEFMGGERGVGSQGGIGGHGGYQPGGGGAGTYASQPGHPGFSWFNKFSDKFTLITENKFFEISSKSYHGTSGVSGARLISKDKPSIKPSPPRPLAGSKSPVDPWTIHPNMKSENPLKVTVPRVNSVGPDPTMGGIGGNPHPKYKYGAGGDGGIGGQGGASGYSKWTVLNDEGLNPHQGHKGLPGKPGDHGYVVVTYYLEDDAHTG